MEQVAQEDVLEELAARQKAEPGIYAYHVVNMAHFGAPQERKRVIAGTPALVSRMQGRADPSACSKGHGCHPSPSGPCGGH